MSFTAYQYDLHQFVDVNLSLRLWVAMAFGVERHSHDANG